MKALSDVVFSLFIKSMYRLGPDVSIGFCGLHHVRCFNPAMNYFNHLKSFISAWSESPLNSLSLDAPWDLTSESASIVQLLLKQMDLTEYSVNDNIAVHRTTIIESGAVLKGPLVIGPQCLVAAGAYLRGGNWIGERCTFGPGSELKSSFVFAGTKLAHFNFVGDSILGERVNLEAGSIICNYRNERDDKLVLAMSQGSLISTGRDKFGALIGDDCRLGANAVVAPGALLRPATVVPRGSVLDQERGHANRDA